jgi:hypothetical protein
MAVEKAMVAALFQPRLRPVLSVPRHNRKIAFSELTT